MLTMAGAIALGGVLMYGAAQASPAYNQNAPSTVQARLPRLPGDWHYGWRYHCGKWGTFTPGWVPVLNGAR